jgi:hypothetical protein
MSKPLINNASLAGIEPLSSNAVEFGWDAARQRLVVFIDCSPRVVSGAAPSSSGKTLLLASTRGFTSLSVPVPGLEGLRINIAAVLPDRAKSAHKARVA